MNADEMKQKIWIHCSIISRKMQQIKVKAKANNT